MCLEGYPKIEQDPNDEDMALLTSCPKCASEYYQIATGKKLELPDDFYEQDVSRETDDFDDLDYLEMAYENDLPPYGEDDD